MESSNCPIGRADALLQTLMRRPSSIVDGRSIAVVVAHPDDETIGCGAMLERLQGVHVALTTNGAPSRPQFWQPKGFATAGAYASARRLGLELALTMARVSSEKLMDFGAIDQEAAFSLFALTQRLKGWFIAHSIEAVLTHAYEGGHPDHDAAAFSVHTAAQLIRRETGQRLAIIEMPFYRMGRSGPVVQEFDNGTAGEVFEIKLRGDEAELKRRMFQAHATQLETLKRFSTDMERFRVAPDYDFSELPNGGEIFYDCRDWTVKSKQWLQLGQIALHDLELRHIGPVSTWENLTWQPTSPKAFGMRRFAFLRPPKPSAYQRMRAGRWTFLH
jgi:N-acetylglucosamine malate deacetylase 2